MLKEIFSNIFLFRNSNDYWTNRYKKGGSSGDGSYAVWAEFKAKVLNDILRKYHIDDVIEFGCGDGNQLEYYEIKNFTGFDISPDAIDNCKERYINDSGKTFHLLSEYDGQQADLTMSIDVIFHLVEDDVFDRHMKLLTDASKKYVLIYSSNYEEKRWIHQRHVRHRQFIDWINKFTPELELVEKIDTRIEGLGPEVNYKQFYFFQKKV